MNKNVNESDFDWTNSISNNPVKWVEPKLTLDNVEKDEDGWPIEESNGDGEIWIDFERFSNDERIEIIEGIGKYLGSELKIYEDNGNIYSCTSNQKKGLILHCGHEETHFFSKENSVCCMSETYNEFMEMERNGNPATTERPLVDGGLFLNKNLTEGFYYKGVNPTVDLVVIRGNKVLLIQRGEDAEAEAGKWALPGGFHDTNAKKGEEWKEDKESSLDAAKREVKEETGLDVDSMGDLNFELVGVYEGGGRDPRDKEDAWTRSTVYMVHIPEDEGHEVKGMDDAQRAEWVPINKVLQHRLAFDHHKIIEKALTMNESDAFSNLGLLTESNDFDWVKDTPAPNPLNSDDWLIMFNNKQQYEEIQRWLFSHGLCWDGHEDEDDGGDCGEPWRSDGPTGFFFKYGDNEYTNLGGVSNGGIDAYSYEDYRKHEMSERIEDDFPNHVQYDWNVIGKFLMDGMVNESSEFGWVEETPEYVGVESLEIGDDIEVVVLNDKSNMFHGLKGKVVNKGISQWDNLLSVSVDWYGTEVINRTIFSTDDSKDQYRFLKEDLDWVKDVQFKVTDEYIRDLMSNCEDIPVTNYNISTKSPYTKRGKMNIMYYSMCPFWWDKVKNEPVDEDGRGKGEWLQSSWHTPDKSVAVIMPDRGGVTDIRGMDNDEFSVIAYDLKGISKHFNGERGELWILLDENGNPRYDLVPDHLVEEVKQGFEGVERQVGLEESFEWTDEIPEEVDVDLWEKIADDIDNEVSGPWGGHIRDRFGGLASVLDRYNIDIEDMGDFFMYPPDGPKDMDGNDITNYQLMELQKDLIRIGVSLTPEQERELNLESVNESDFDWTSEVPAGDSYRYFDINVCYVSYYDEETGEDDCREGGSYFLKIPVDVVPNIWDYEADDHYVAGPGDEGYDVIQWCLENDLLDETDFDDVQYVTELPKSDYCRAWGNWQEEDKELCSRFINEDLESEFDWVEEHEPFQPGKEKYMIDFTTEDEDASGYFGFGERKRRGQMKEILRKLGYNTEFSLLHQYFYLNTHRKGLGGWHVEVDDYEEGDYIYDNAREEGYQIITPTEFFEMTRGSY